MKFRTPSKLTQVAFLSALASGFYACNKPKSLENSKVHASTPAVPAAVELGMNDVSILLPLPQKMSDAEIQTQLLHPDSKGKHGELVPPQFWKQLGTIDGQHFGSEFAVVGMRLDPCFPDLALLASKPTDCHRQLRLTLQHPKNGSTEAGIHLLYDISAAEFSDLLKSFSAIGDHTPAGLKMALGVHPLIAKEGLKGQAAQSLYQAVLKNVGSDNLVGMSLIRLPFPGSWMFEVYDIKAGKLVERTASSQRADFGESFDPATGGFGNSMASASGLDEAGNDFLKQIGSADPARAKEFVERSFELDNPSLTKFTTTKCVFCHSANVARDGILSTQTDKAVFDKSPKRFTSVYPLQNNTKNYRFMQLNFGSTITDGPRVSQRVINETAEVLLALKKFGLPK